MNQLIVEDVTMADADMHFGSLGVQYYTAGRCAFLARLSPVAANLFHHAIEMLLKAHLSQLRTLKELRSPFGHHLAKLWEEFKASCPTENLAAFDVTVELLNEFEVLRYPDSVLQKGAAILFQFAQPVLPPNAGVGAFTTPRYTLVLNDIDHLVAAIFRASSRNPSFYTSGMNNYAQTAIMQDNPAAEFLLPPALRTS